jgi:hypothetical protein
MPPLNCHAIVVKTDQVSLYGLNTPQSVGSALVGPLAPRPGALPVYIPWAITDAKRWRISWRGGMGHILPTPPQLTAHAKNAIRGLNLVALSSL